MFKDAIATWKKVHGEEHPLVAIGLNNLAQVYQAQVSTRSRGGAAPSRPGSLNHGSPAVIEMLTM